MGEVVTDLSPYATPLVRHNRSGLIATFRKLSFCKLALLSGNSSRPYRRQLDACFFLLAQRHSSFASTLYMCWCRLQDYCNMSRRNFYDQQMLHHFELHLQHLDKLGFHTVHPPTSLAVVSIPITTHLRPLASPVAHSLPPSRLPESWHTTVTALLTTRQQARSRNNWQGHGISGKATE